MLVLLAGIGTGLVLSLESSPGAPQPTLAAVRAFEANELPEAPPQRPAPDLSATGLVLLAGGHIVMSGVSVDVFSYRHGAGDRTFVYLASRSFPPPAAAQDSSGAAAIWSARMGSATVMSGGTTLTYLVVGTNPAMVHGAQALLAIRA